MVFTIVANLQAKQEYIPAIKAKLIDASRVYQEDKGTIDWFVHQSRNDPSSFIIVERFEDEAGVKVHQENPYYKAFGLYMGPILAEPVRVQQFNELDTSKAVQVPEQTW